MFFDVVCKRGIALRAFQRIPANAAKNIAGCAAPVQEEDRLLTFFKHFLQPVHQCLAEDAPVARLKFCAHVHHLDGWQLLVHDPFG